MSTEHHIVLFEHKFHDLKYETYIIIKISIYYYMLKINTSKAF